MARRLRVALVFGGPSVEHEVSVQSARSVLAGLEAGRHECVPVGVTETGRWLPPDRSEAILRGAAARVEDGGDVRVRVDPGANDLLVADGRNPVQALRIDVVFPLIHGWGGEDGRIQGLLEWAGVPYVGSGVLGSAVGMDKQMAKALFERADLPVGPWLAFRAEEYRDATAVWHDRIARELGFPVFVKPANGGSSVGVGRVVSPEGLPAAVDRALECDAKVVVEQGLDAREVECAVIGNAVPEASVAGEIVPSREFYDYAAKYEDGTSELRIPAPLSAAATETVRRLAVEAYRAVDLSGFARVDFFVERAGERVFLNEVNTLPGFTSISMFPKLWEASGVPYPDLLGRLVRLGLERWDVLRARATRRL